MKRMLVVTVMVTTLSGISAFAGHAGGNGGDPVALQFQQSAVAALHDLAQHKSEFPELDLARLERALDQAELLVVDTPLYAAIEGVSQQSTALNFPGQNRIEINRSQWNVIQSRDLSKALALHEILGLTGYEGTGNYRFSQIYFDELGLALPTSEVAYHYESDAIGCTRPNTDPKINSTYVQGHNPGFFGECGDVTSIDPNLLRNLLWQHSLSGHDLLDLRGAVFKGMALRNASFERVDLTGSNFTGAHLEGSYFNGSSLEVADFEGASLQAVSFTGANGFVADFESANLNGADISEMLLSHSSLSLARMDDDTILPEKWTIADFEHPKTGKPIVYDPTQDAQLELTRNGKRVVLTTKMDQDTEGGSVLELSKADPCYRGEISVVSQILDNFQDDAESCDGGGIEGERIVYSHCTDESGDPVYGVVIPRCAD